MAGNPEREDRDEVPEGGKSDYEIAEIMGITRSAVWQIRQRAMRKLKRLADSDPDLLAAAAEVFG